MTEFQVDKSLAKKVWKKLKSGDVPIVTKYDLDHVHESINDLNEDLYSNAYMPDVGNGYLGLQKGNGVTRFIPILTKEDMAVYYQMCTLIGDKVLASEKGIFGGWHSVPKSIKNL